MITIKKQCVFLIAYLIAALGLLSSAAAAYDYVSSDGHRYTVECNRSGYVLQSTHPVSRYEEGGAMSRFHDLKREKIYLGKDCDAFHEVVGGGKWCWANGGFVAEFPTFRFGFPRQELSCPNNPLCLIRLHSVGAQSRELLQSYRVAGRHRRI